MDYLLDTSVIIDALRNKQETVSFIKTKLAKEYLCTSAICIAELFEGVYREVSKEKISQRKDQVLDLVAKLSKVVEFDSSQAEIAGKIRAELDKKGEGIDDMDILIAASCIVTNSVLVTKNPRHFSRVPNLKLEDSFLPGTS